MNTDLQTKFFIDGINVTVAKINTGLAKDKLPVAVYSLKHCKFTGFYLETFRDHLEIPETIYGDLSRRVDKCVQTYRERDSSTGILLTGDKGAGKSLTMAMLANKALTELELPVILIKQGYAGDQFTSFIEDLGECCLVFDEFGKMYSGDSRYGNRPVAEDGTGPMSQKQLLGLMDGVDKIKRMIIMTENSEWDISSFILNRPSRVYYHFKYKKLEEKSIIGYAEDHGVPEDVINDIVEMSRRSRLFTFDMLQSIVEEYNRFQEPVKTICSDLNIDISDDMSISIDVVKVVKNDTEEEVKVVGPTTFAKPSLSDYFTVRIADPNYSGHSLATRVNKLMEDMGEDIQMPEQEEEVRCEDIYVNNENIIYESGDNVVYQTDEYTISTLEVQKSKKNYSLLF